MCLRSGHGKALLNCLLVHSHLQGGECFPVFMKSGLDKGLLKRMWDLVAGNAGSLNAEQFFKCMYLMDGCRRGAALPAVLPPGPWPQVISVHTYV
jgi:hypothetical protein